jgi:hypothetical protein
MYVTIVGRKKRGRGERKEGSKQAHRRKDLKWGS